MTIDNNAVEELLREIGQYQLKGYNSLAKEDIKVKEDTEHGSSVVTEYDVETERRVQSYIQDQFPDDSFLGEELGNMRKDSRRYWILDPIDGTSNFTQGIPFWGPSLAFWDESGPARGWIFLPALDQMFRASLGGGAFLNGVQLRTSSITEYSNLCTVATVSRLHRGFQLTCPAKHRILGSIVANLAYLATGTFVAMHCRGSLWDLAAGVLLAREAGAIIDCDPTLEGMDPASVDATHPTSISVYGMANPELSHLGQFIKPLKNPIQGN